MYELSIFVLHRYLFLVLFHHSVLSAPPSTMQPNACAAGSTPGASKRGPKRSQSRFVSPLIKDRREKRPKLDAAMDTVKGSLDFSGEDGSSSTELGRLSEKKATLLTRLKERKEELRKLRMVKMYRTKVREIDLL